MDLTNKVILITGASDGLGKSLALQLKDNGVNLALLARNVDKLKIVQQEIGSKCKIYPCDITDVNQIGNSIKAVIGDFGNIDVLVNNAGIFYDDNRVNPEIITRMINTNLAGTIQMTQQILPYMQKRNSGQILNVMSIAGVDFSSIYGIYTATKYGLRGYTESLRLKLAATNIKVMGLYPAGMDTNIMAASGISMPANYNAMMKKEDVARVIIFMLSQPDDIMLNHVEVRKVNERF